MLCLSGVAIPVITIHGLCEYCFWLSTITLKLLLTVVVSAIFVSKWTNFPSKVFNLLSNLLINRVWSSNFFRKVNFRAYFRVRICILCRNWCVIIAISDIVISRNSSSLRSVLGSSLMFIILIKGLWVKWNGFISSFEWLSLHFGSTLLFFEKRVLVHH